MYKEYKHKKQGDGSDSWTCTEYETNKKKVIINKYMVYEDPKTKVELFTPEEIEYIRKELGL